uniref:SnoaL-like domain-containing protein n=1 Tax=Chromera velia CCMP2878 TaxID=1169474 RepID=A0A0G4GCQ7_9ALVE|eukprot:Cvel_4519.t1-p1 / transcript=Cvel_4519.t1 / gene=Cvel_4519 / organism=Chromera_velia_CCMP2878 / gene_product=hypothetical protein / transcript_product=hypothetical protein / location=Cvel_scaffold198:9494-12550(-) / protein_length=561 / sequence_SO=supercontig / SO=protein_coding / is_pseudo=false
MGRRSATKGLRLQPLIDQSKDTQDGGPSSPLSPVLSTSFSSVPSSLSQCTDAADVALLYFDSYNQKNMTKAASVLAKEAVYEDMVYPGAFTSQREFEEHLRRVERNTPAELKFNVDAISRGDEEFTGVAWHVEIDGRPFPNARGASFYRCKRSEEDGLLRVVYGRDLVEPASKPGDSSLFVLGLVTKLIRIFPDLLEKAEPPNYLAEQFSREGRETWGVEKRKELKKNDNQDSPQIDGLEFRPSFLTPAFPNSYTVMCVLYAAYLGFVLFSEVAPGNAAWKTSPETLTSLLDQSLDFFFITPVLKGALDFVGLGGIFLSSLVPAPFVPPPTLAVFNFFNAWSLMHGSLIFSDLKAEGKTNKLGAFLGTFFLTNIFFIPFMVARESPVGSEAAEEECGASTEVCLKRYLEDPQRLSEKKGLRPSYAQEWEEGRGNSIEAAVRSVMVNSRSIGLVGGLVGVVAFWWFFFAYGSEFGSIGDRLAFEAGKLSSDRVEFAFGVDFFIYSIMQAGFVGADMDRRAFEAERRGDVVEWNRVDGLRWSRFLPFFGEAFWLFQKGERSER